ncbi:MAG: type II toxin-antitoxin system RelE/ParE family toxin [Candidatus Pacebacteria bacterium]|nr:type II toxin-antitoxin system RelE/ParE family toxin [Candidatus Paceibacterota bacterium]
MTRIIYTKSFLRSAKNLPLVIQKKLAKQLEVLTQNPFNPLLHSKPLVAELAGFYSFRIIRDWRVIFCFINAEIIKLVDVAHRKDIYK